MYYGQRSRRPVAPYNTPRISVIVKIIIIITCDIVPGENSPLNARSVFTRSTFTRMIKKKKRKKYRRVSSEVYFTHFTS